MRELRPLEKVYYIRFALGLIAALACAGYVIGVYQFSLPSDWQPSILFNSISIALIVYLASYYGIKAKFRLQVEKTQKLFTTGIGIYLLSWLVFYTLIYSIFAQTPPA